MLLTNSDFAFDPQWIGFMLKRPETVLTVNGAPAMAFSADPAAGIAIAAGDVPGRVAIRATSIGARRRAIARRARPRDRSGTTLRLVAARRRLLCIYQHAPTPGAPGIYRHRLYLAELVRRGWDVDLISTPVNYMRGTVPERYAGKPYVRRNEIRTLG